MMRSLLRTLSLLVAACAWPAQAAPPSPLPADADELVALPGGGWLALAAGGLQLWDAVGTRRASLALRGESLDARIDGDAGLATLIDANAERVLPVRIDLRRFTLTALPLLPPGAQSLAAACLVRDAQGRTNVFAIGRSGIAEQWVLHGESASLVRRLAVAPEVEHCRGDDRRHELLVSEPAGVWAHGAEPEGKASRRAVALRRPFGSLEEGGGPIAVLGEGVLVADPGRGALRWFRSGKQGPSQARRAARDASLSLALSRGAEPEQLVVWSTPQGLRVATRDASEGTWNDRPLARELARASSPQPAGDEGSLPIVLPTLQTEPVAQFGDAADDPAIWIDPRDASRSRVLATDKKRGLAVYDLQGRERQFLPVGRLNNVDVRQDVRIGDERLDIAVASQRDDNTVVVFRIAADGELSEAARLPTGFTDIYGICLHRTPAGAAEVIVNDKDGRFLQLRIARGPQGWVGEPRRQFRLASQPEGCVADDARGRLFVGEEKRGVWSLALDAAPGDTEAATPRLILPVGRWLHADVEGMALYQGDGASYLVVSSQGNDSYVVLDALPPHAVRGAFRIGMNLDAGIDGVSETDGLDVNSAAFGPQFPRGLLVVQDGHKRLPEGPQNFKLVSWEDVRRVLGLP